MLIASQGGLFFKFFDPFFTDNAHSPENHFVGIDILFQGFSFLHTKFAVPMRLLHKTLHKNYIFVFTTIGTNRSEALLALMFFPADFKILATEHTLLFGISLDARIVPLKKLHHVLQCYKYVKHL